jgi:hypothetical protein
MLTRAESSSIFDDLHLSLFNLVNDLVQHGLREVEIEDL